MGNIHHFFGKLSHFPLLELLEIPEFLAGDAVNIVHIALVNNKFGTERIARFLFKLLQDIRAYRRGIPIPVYILFPCQFIKNQGELMEKCGIADHVNMRIVLDVFPQALHGKFLCLWLAHVKGNLLLKVCPAICHCIIHMHRVPHNVSKETYCVIMEFLCAMDCHFPCYGFVPPPGRRHWLPCGTVNDFPPSCNVILVIYL